MKKWNAISIFIVLVTGMVLLSGCMSPDSTSPTPVATLTKEIVQETTVLPVMPTPGTTIPAPVPTTIPTTKPTSVPTIKPTTKPTPVPTTVPTSVPKSMPTTDGTPGALFIHIRAGGCGGDLKVFIARAGTEVSPPVYYYLPDKTIIEGANTGYSQVKILMDGNSYMVEFPPGTYIANLPDMKGGVPEQQSFTISPGVRTDIWFQGTLLAASSRGC
jgi:hypothetical protein